MKPIYWILIIVGVVVTSITTTAIIAKRGKEKDKSKEAEEVERRAALRMSSI